MWIDEKTDLTRILILSGECHERREARERVPRGQGDSVCKGRNIRIDSGNSTTEGG